MKKNLFYTIVRPIASIYFKVLYRPKYIGLDNIPKSGRVVLAGTHTNNLDCLMLLSSTKRHIHFLAKIELFRGVKKIIFGNMGLIPVDRKNKTTNPLECANKYLNEEEVIGIFPEGTINRGSGPILPFKIGAVKMAHDTNSLIVPFVIKGKYKIFSKDLVIEFREGNIEGYKVEFLDANEDLLKQIKEAQENPKAENILPQNAYYLSENEILCNDRDFGVSRFPYTSDGLILWAYSNGIIEACESTFHIFKPLFSN